MKTNRITEEIILSVIFTDGYNYVYNLVSLYRETFVVGNNYRRHRITDGIYRILKKKKQCDDVEFFQTILLTKWPRDSNRDLRTVTCPIHHQNYRRVYQQDVSVCDSIGKSQYIRTLLSLSSISPSSPLTNCKQAPTPPKNISLFLKHSSFLYFCMWSQHLFSVYCGFYHFL